MKKAGAARPKAPAPDAPWLPKEAWKRTFEGFSIDDVAVRSRSIVYLSLLEEPPDEEDCSSDDDRRARLAGLYLAEEKDEEKIAHQGLAGFSQPVAGVSLRPVEQGLLASLNGDVFAMGSGQKGMEKISPAKPDLGVCVSRVRCIGATAYTAGIVYQVFRREAVGTWAPLPRTGLPKGELSADFVVSSGFDDVDGFAENDLYAAGRAGNLFRWDGSRWRACGLPSQETLQAVCCGGDGFVYVAAERALFRGREKQWEKVAEYHAGLRPRSRAVWFDGALWLAGDYSLLRFVDGRTAPRPDMPPGDRVDARDGLLVVTTDRYVRAFDGRSWRLLVAPYDTTRA